MIGALRILEVALPLVALTSPPDSAYTTASGGAGEEWSFSLVESSAHELVVAGFTDSFGAGTQDGWLVGYDEHGDSLWSQTLGGSGSDQLLYVLPVEDDGFIACGISTSESHGQRDLWLVRTGSRGELRWSKTYGGAHREIAHCIQQAPDGGYIVAGRSESHKHGVDMDAFMLKVSENGDSLWSRTFGGSGYDLFFHVETQPDGYVMTGITTSNAEGPYDALIIKTNLLGDSLWGHTIGGAGHDRFRSAVSADDGGCYAGGFTDTYGAGSFDFWLMRFDALGERLWDRTYGGESQEMCFMTISAADSFLVMCGHTFSFGSGHADAWLLKVNAQGDSIWSKTFGGPENDDIYGLIETADKGYAACGYTQSFSGDKSFDFWLIKTEPDTAAIDYVPIDQAAQLNE